MPAFRLLADSGNRAAIGLKITLGIGRRPCRLAQHIETGGEAAIVAPLHPLHRFIDGPTHDENLPHQPHRSADALAHKGLPCPRNQSA